LARDGRKHSSDKKPQKPPPAPPLQGGVKGRLLWLCALLVLSVVAAAASYYVEQNNLIQFRTSHRVGDLDMRGARIVFRTTPEEFLSLPYEARAKRIASWVAAVVGWTQSFTGSRDITEVASRLNFEANRTVRIGAPGDYLSGAFRLNYEFTKDVRYPDSQDRFVRMMVSFINQTDGAHLSYDEYLRKMRGFTDTGFLRPTLSSGARWYVERAMILRDIARAIPDAAGAPARALLDALTEWTFINVSNHFERALPGRPEFTDYNDLPLELMIRGMGSCDRSAWVLSKLAYHAGLESNIVYLHKPGMEGKGSFHTIAEVRAPDGRWRAVDPFNNIIYDKSVIELARDTDYFRNSWIFPNHATPSAFLPVMKIAEDICRFYVPDQRLFFDVGRTVTTFVEEHFPDARAEAAGKILMGMCQGYAVKMDPDPVSLTRWELPFWLRGYYYQRAYLDYKFKKLPFLKKIREARIQQLLGHYEAAEAGFEDMRRLENGDVLFNEERAYFAVLNDYYKGDYPSVVESVRRFEAKYPAIPRNQMLRYVLAKSLVQLNRPAEAAMVYPEGRNFEAPKKALFASP